MRSAPHRQVDVAAGQPADRQRLLRVGARLVADVLPRAVVDLPSRLFDDAEDDHDPAAGLELPAYEAHGLEVEALAFAGREEAANAEVAVVAGASPVRGQEDVLAALGLLVQDDVDVEVLLVGDE